MYLRLNDIKHKSIKILRLSESSQSNDRIKKNIKPDKCMNVLSMKNR